MSSERLIYSDLKGKQSKVQNRVPFCYYCLILTKDEKEKTATLITICIQIVYEISFEKYIQT